MTNDNTEWKVGMLVEVAPRMWAGINRPGGTGRITCLHCDDDGDVEGIDVKYVVESGVDTMLNPILVKPSDVAQGRRRRITATTTGKSDQTHQISPVPKAQRNKENDASSSPHGGNATLKAVSHKSRCSNKYDKPRKRSKPQSSKERIARHEKQLSNDDASSATPPWRKTQKSAGPIVPQEIVVPPRHDHVFSPLRTGAEERPQRQYMLQPNKMRCVFEQQMRHASDFCRDLLDDGEPREKETPESPRRKAFVTTLFDMLREHDDTMAQDVALIEVGARTSLAQSLMEVYMKELEDDSRIMRSDGHIFAV